ncbi:hypothetical protein MES5069_200051 [Mesorhizobium escarrei]|uniref:Uncharacterized protein n=1 Tax=Mesorhizobium escarrei TaxID=666018 RepID=A0ABM9DPE0_9HYPH|nr:hypothetical protein MES5069_200051 [Mesorhizobium escarrei]
MGSAPVARSGSGSDPDRLPEFNRTGLWLVTAQHVYEFTV